MLRARTFDERTAYLEGFEAGAKAALLQVRRLNFSDVAERAEPHINAVLHGITHTTAEVDASERTQQPEEAS